MSGASPCAGDGWTVSLKVIDTACAPPVVRTALLSAGECYAAGPRMLRVALWPASRTTHALRGQGAAALNWVEAGAFHQAQTAATYLGELPCGLACFALRLDSGEAQRVPYAELRSGIRFELGGARAEVLARWARQIEEMRALG